MESFFRYITYVDYYKNGEKTKNVGFLRWKLHNEIHSLEIQVKDVSSFRGIYEIKEKNTQKILGEIVMDKGIGSFIRKFPSMSEGGDMYIEAGDDRLYLRDVEGVIICSSRNEFLFTSVKLKQEKKDMEAASENVLIEGIKEKYEEEKIQEVIEPPTICEFEEPVKKPAIYEVEEKPAKLTVKKKLEIIEPLHEDKWQQLCREYPNVHPFSGKNTFLSIKPEDFIILQQEYQKLVHNSFLLHGFYNYGHMILGKLTKEKEAPVYIGVPGVYYEREKQAARMFGFVGFESTEQPVQSGSYGYYMIEVKI